MKGLKLSLIVMTATLITLGLSGMAFAFHAGGVAECGLCHSMHAPAPGGTKLLIKTDQSSTCLFCHSNPGDTAPSSYHILTLDADAPAGSPPVHRTPGGDFGWIRKTYSYTLRGEAMVEPGQEHGHNVVAKDYGLETDPDKPTAPGGVFNSTNLGCTSCHDPHGQFRRDSSEAVQFRAGGPIIASGSYNNSPGNGSTALPAGQTVGVYRLLAGSGYNTGGVTFNGVPQAVAPSTYNRSEVTFQTRVAYGNKATNGHVKWGTWCATCHGKMHTEGGNYVHKVDWPLSGDIRQIYQQYKGSGNMTGADATSYLSLVPFAENNKTYALLGPNAQRNDTKLQGPSSDQDEVNCLSCHRAHASGFKNALRWNMEGEMILIDGSWPGTDATKTAAQEAKWSQGRTYKEMAGAYYEYPESKFASYQRVLCNKCHAKD